MLTYKSAGVDIRATSAVKRRIGRMVRMTYSPQVLSEIGLFGSLYELKGYKHPVLVASCDGVGTKLTVARMMNKHDTVGEDIVNHSVNDILTLGARPLFFLDYIAYAKLPSKTVPDVIKGLVRGCKRNGCALIGGETAMMPGLYPKGDYDLAGMIVGVVEKKDIIKPARIRSGDVILGLPSTGLHTNGYSLARKILFDRMKLRPADRLPPPAARRPQSPVSSSPIAYRLSPTAARSSQSSVGSALLRVHRSYLAPLTPWLKQVHALAHITGGGFRENIERLLPRRVDCIIYKDSWRVPDVFRVIQQGGKVPDSEMYHVFNMGIGMVVIVDKRVAVKMLSSIPDARLIGEVTKGSGTVTLL
jgi:phosphoribosylformylglycinamidine cyclo-ligase